MLHRSNFLALIPDGSGNCADNVVLGYDLNKHSVCMDSAFIGKVRLEILSIIVFSSFFFVSTIHARQLWPEMLIRGVHICGTLSISYT